MICTDATGGCILCSSLALVAVRSQHNTQEGFKREAEPADSTVYSCKLSSIFRLSSSLRNWRACSCLVSHSMQWNWKLRKSHAYPTPFFWLSSMNWFTLHLHFSSLPITAEKDRDGWEWKGVIGPAILEPAEMCTDGWLEVKLGLCWPVCLIISVIEEMLLIPKICSSVCLCTQHNCLPTLGWQGRSWNKLALCLFQNSFFHGG